MSTVHHVVGSTSMLPRDRGGVVDAQLKVHGTRNLRVVDAGVVPLHFSAHPQAAVYALAEQGEQLLVLVASGRRVLTRVQRRTLSRGFLRRKVERGSQGRCFEAWRLRACREVFAVEMIVQIV
jgi:hypothetical protein